MRVELGWRWDGQGYTDTPSERQLSPRFSVRRDRRANALRLLGRYFQSQGIHELQVEDGVTGSRRAQRADQAVIGLQHRFGERYSAGSRPTGKLRQLRPRFENAFDPLALIPELEPDRVRVAPEGAARAASRSRSRMREPAG